MDLDEVSVLVHQIEDRFILLLGRHVESFN